MQAIFGSLVLAAVMVLGLAACAWAAMLFHRGHATRSWPSAEGAVIRSWVVRKGSNVGRNSSGNMRPLYFPEVEYGYQAAGRQFRGDRVFAGAGLPYQSESEAARVVAGWPAGLKVKVYYNPSNPAESVLVTGPNRRAVLCWGLSGAFLVAISVFLFLQIEESAFFTP